MGTVPIFEGDCPSLGGTGTVPRKDERAFQLFPLRKRRTVAVLVDLNGGLALTRDRP